MSTVLIVLLTGSALAPLIGAVGVLLPSRMKNQNSGLRIASLAFASGSICAGLLAVLLCQQSPDLNVEIRSPLWVWLSFSVHQSPSISFGLIATVGKAALVCLFGILAMLALRSVNSKSMPETSEAYVATVSVLCAGGTIFVLAPTTAQAFLGWCIFSFAVGTLRWGSHNRRNQVDFLTRAGGLRATGTMTDLLEHVWLRYLWKPITEQFPNWLTEQAEEFRSHDVSLQDLASILGTFAILLTWLL